MIDTGTQEVIENEPIDQIVYGAVDASDKKRVAFLSHYSKLGLIYCHVFTTKDKVRGHFKERVKRERERESERERERERERACVCV